MSRSMYICFKLLKCEGEPQRLSVKLFFFFCQGKSKEIITLELKGGLKLIQNEIELFSVHLRTTYLP